MEKLPLFEMIGDELKARLKEVRASQRELAEFMKVDHRVVHRLVSGERKFITTEESEAIRHFFELRQRPLQASLSVTRPPAKLEAHVETTPLRSSLQVLYGGIETSEGSRIWYSPNAIIGGITLHPAQLSTALPFAVKVAEGAMSPRFEIGEIAYVVFDQPLVRGQDCLVVYHDSTARIFQFVEQTDKCIRVKQFKPKQSLDISVDAGVRAYAIVGRG